MNIKEIKEMLQLMADHGLTEIEIEKDGMKIKLKKGSGGTFVSEEIRGGHSMGMPIGKGEPSAVGYGVKGHGMEAGQVGVEENVVVIKAPMVGTFYAAPGPDQPAYASVGKAVHEGDVLCIIEAMKLMNEIKAEMHGTVQEILVRNGQPVEFDQPLFKIRKG